MTSTTTMPMPVWLFPNESEQIFGGWNEDLNCFILGCVVPEQKRTISYWPGNCEVTFDVPDTLWLQYTPILYGKKGRIQGAEIICGCTNCKAYDNNKAPRLKIKHFANHFESQFCIFQLIKEKSNIYIRRLAVGNNKKPSVSSPLSSIICWGSGTIMPMNLLEANNKFWSGRFSFSYTGKEQTLDDPTGYKEFLYSYKESSCEDAAKASNDKKINITTILKSLDPLTVASEHHDGLAANPYGFPRHKPRVYWADRKIDGWHINGKLSVNEIEIKSLSNRKKK